MNINKKTLIDIVVVIVIIVAIVFAYFYYKKAPDTADINAIEQAGNSSDQLNKDVSQGVLPSIDPQSNPMESAPDVNPVSKTNPFSNIKTNPFK